MKARPIPFSEPMVRAILEGRKSVTRRIVKPQPETRESNAVPGQFGIFLHGWNLEHPAVGPENYAEYCPYGQPGDVLWVRETWGVGIALEVTGVRVEQLQDISRGDCMAEGCPFPNMADADPVGWFQGLWCDIKGPESWNANPWVWVVEFTPHRMNVDAFLASRKTA